MIGRLSPDPWNDLRVGWRADGMRAAKRYGSYGNRTSYKPEGGNLRSAFHSKAVGSTPTAPIVVQLATDA